MTIARARKPELSPVLIPWIEALAKQAAKDYLRSQAAPGNDSSTERTERVPLPAFDKAA